jgi:hypothetical protein
MITRVAEKHSTSCNFPLTFKTSWFHGELELNLHNILFTSEAYFTCDGVNNSRISGLRDHDKPHGTVESDYQHRFSVNV